jgi:hypothetical protein
VSAYEPVASTLLWMGRVESACGSPCSCNSPFAPTPTAHRRCTLPGTVVLPEALSLVET